MKGAREVGWTRRWSPATAILAVSLCGVVHAQQERPFGLADVRTIFVADLGASEVARGFRKQVEKEVENVGFDVTRDPDDADALLGGLVVERATGDGFMLVFRNVTLRAGRDGRTLWFAKFRGAKPMARQAKSIAKALRAEVERAVWKAARGISR
jgi:hypothetical protein